jgi:hypothetical protein
MAVEPELASILAHHAVDRVRVHAPALAPALPVVLDRPEQRPVDIGPVPGEVDTRVSVQRSADSSRGHRGGRVCA